MGLKSDVIVRKAKLKAWRQEQQGIGLAVVSLK